MISQVPSTVVYGVYVYLVDSRVSSAVVYGVSGCGSGNFPGPVRVLSHHHTVWEKAFL